MSSASFAEEAVFCVFAATSRTVADSSSIAVAISAIPSCWSINDWELYSQVCDVSSEAAANATLDADISLITEENWPNVLFKDTEIWPNSLLPS